MSTIPASLLVSVNPNVLPAGGNALDLVGLMLTASTRVPIGEVLSFPNDGSSVADYFGAGSTEAATAAIYFAGYDTSSQKPASVLFTQYPTAAVGAYLRGGPVGTLTLAQLQAITAGTLTLSVNGTPITSSSISLASATSFSNAATLIEAGFTSPGFSVTYDSVSEGFLFTTTATGASETIAFPTTDAFATALFLTQATGAVLSQGADVAVPGTFMDAVVAQDQNWASFMTLFDPDAGSGNTEKLAFATWTNQQNKRFVYVAGDTDVTPTESNNATTSLGYILRQDKYNGTIPVDGDPNSGWTEAAAINLCAFVCGAIASIDFTATNGRTTLAFRGQAGLPATVTNATIYENLLANGYNCYAVFATANQNFIEFQPGSISGEFEWADSYVNQIQFNNAMQLALMELLQQSPSIPYNQFGYELIKAACQDPINAALNFGTIRAGVVLSSAQAAEINAAAGAQVSGTVQNLGYYLQVKDPGAQARQARTSPIVNIWYADGESVQQINLTSVLVQ